VRFEATPESHHEAHEDHEGASRKDNVLSFMSFMLFMVSSSPSFFSSFTCVLARESLSSDSNPRAILNARSKQFLPFFLAATVRRPGMTI
jgi:hypothetical protein